MISSNTKAYIGHLLDTYKTVDTNEKTRLELLAQVQKVKRIASNKRYTKDTVNSYFDELERKITEAMISSRVILDKEQLILDKEDKSLMLIKRFDEKLEKMSGERLESEKKLDAILKRLDAIDKRNQTVGQLSEIVGDLKESIDQFRMTIQKFNLKDAQIKEIDDVKAGMTNLNLKLSAVMNDEKTINQDIRSFEENIVSEINTRKEEFMLVEKQIGLLDDRYKTLSKDRNISPKRLKEFKQKIEETKKRLRTIRK